MIRRFHSFAGLGLTAALALSQTTAPKAAATAAKKPVFVFLYARVTDHVNVEIAEDQLRRLLPMVERYRREHAEQHVTATILFSGAVSQVLEDRNRQTHIRDFVLDYIHRGVVQAGYDGTDEPTYGTRPTVDVTKEMLPQERAKALIAEEQNFLTRGRDPLTGAPKPDTSGGLKKMQVVFGEANCITGVEAVIRGGPGAYTPMGSPARPRATPGNVPPPPVPVFLMPEVGGDTEAVLASRAYNTRAIMFGMSDANVAHLPGFGGARTGFSTDINPGPDTSSDLYWQDNVLRSSETSTGGVRLVRASDGVSELQKVTDKMDRSSVRVVHIEIGSEQAYVTPEFAKGPEFPPVRYAYIHTDKPTLPVDYLLPKAAVEAAYQKQEAVLKWLVREFLPANSGSGFVSAEDLARMTEPANGYTISVPALQSAVADFLKRWGNNTNAPSLFQVGGHYLSRAELFQVLADALAEFHHSGKLPETLTVAQVYGPVRLLTGHGPNIGEVKVADVAKICAEIAPSLHQTSADVTEPKNVIPIGLTINGALLNPAQFVRLMALALTNPNAETTLNIRMAYELTELGELVPKSRPASDSGFIWTLKPVTVRTDRLTAQAER